MSFTLMIIFVFFSSFNLFFVGICVTNCFRMNILLCFALNESNWHIWFGWIIRFVKQKKKTNNNNSFAIYFNYCSFMNELQFLFMSVASNIGLAFVQKYHFFNWITEFTCSTRVLFHRFLSAQLKLNSTFHSIVFLLLSALFFFFACTKC